ncbi:HD domain-containing protein [Mesorhizobium sp. LNHC209A00]|uniref:HD domain-containing protein n=1 Tax=Mesorhizobium TaxID=68287 RepID=UPI0003D00CF2|nr:HD domain-containing protein [Mesorhizobium sp. LNHC209A00]ESY94341.1 phosphohydrolase [Mesorhizobium sp. LNHC209A00]
MTGKDISGINIPDSKMAREVTQFIRDTESDFLFRHSTRVYFWAALAGRQKDLIFDSELLYTAAMFHDVGLTHGYHESQLRFEVDSANAAREFLRSHSISERNIEKVWAAIALHTTPGIPEHMHPEIALVQAGAGMDVAGVGYDSFTDEQRYGVTSAYPRGDFKHEIIETFYQGMKHRPDSTFGTFNDDFLAFKEPNFQRANLCSIILSSHWNN